MLFSCRVPKVEMVLRSFEDTSSMMYEVYIKCIMTRKEKGQRNSPVILCNKEKKSGVSYSGIMMIR